MGNETLTLLFVLHPKREENTQSSVCVTADLKEPDQVRRAGHLTIPTYPSWFHASPQMNRDKKNPGFLKTEVTLNILWWETLHPSARIMEWPGLEEILKALPNPIPKPCHGQGGHLPLAQVAQIPMQPGLEQSLCCPLKRVLVPLLTDGGKTALPRNEGESLIPWINPDYSWNAVLSVCWMRTSSCTGKNYIMV